MDDLLDHLIYRIASGHAFFLGSALILLGLALSGAVKSKGWLVLRDLGVIVGGVLVAVSATPFPTWFTQCWAAFLWFGWFRNGSGQGSERNGSFLFDWLSLSRG